MLSITTFNKLSVDVQARAAVMHGSGFDPFIAALQRSDDERLQQLSRMPWLVAIMLGDEVEIAKQLELCDKPNELFEGWSPLMMACCLGRLSAVELLCANEGVDVNASLLSVNRFDEANALTPLYLAIHAGASRAVQTLLLRKDCLLEVHASLPHEMRSQPGLIRNHHTPLTYAAQLGNADVVYALLKRGANINALAYTGAHGRPALWHAAIAGHQAVIDRLLHCVGLRVSVFDDSQRDLLCQAIVDGDSDRVRRLVALGVDVNRIDPVTQQTPLMLACQFRNAAAVEHLLRDPLCNTELRNRDGMTALHITLDETDPGSIQCLQMLVDSGCVDLEAERRVEWLGGGCSYSPLLLAATEKNHAAIRLLLHGGANIAARSTVSGATMLYVMLDALVGSRQTCQALMARLLPGLSIDLQLRCADVLVAHFRKYYTESARMALHEVSGGRLPWLSSQSLPKGYVEIESDEVTKHLSYSYSDMDYKELARLLVPLKDRILAEIQRLPDPETKQRIATMAANDDSTFYHALFHARVWPWPFRAPDPERGRLGAIHALVVETAPERLGVMETK